MKLSILSRAPECYSTRRLVEAGLCELDALDPTLRRSGVVTSNPKASRVLDKLPAIPDVDEPGS